MTLTTTVSGFRNNLAEYIDALLANKSIAITDGRRGNVLLRIRKEDEEKFDWEAHMKWMEGFKPFWTDKDTKHLESIRKATRNRLKKLNW